MARSCTHGSTVRLSAIFLLSLAIFPPLASPAQSTTDARVQTLARILADYNDAKARRDPLAATHANDKRDADQLPDLSVAAENAWLERQQTFIQRLSEVDMAGLPDQTLRPAEALLNTLIEAQSRKHVPQWQMPLDQFNRLNAQMMALARQSSFSTVKDYGDYLTRLKKLPSAFSQIMTNLQLGRDQGRFALDTDVSRAQDAIQAVTASSAETSPFAAPLKHFPASISPDDRKRITTEILDAISNDVLPAYTRTDRFIAAMPVPAMTNGRISPP